MRVQNGAACLLLACALTIPATPVPLAFAEGEQPETGLEQSSGTTGEQPTAENGNAEGNAATAATSGEGGEGAASPTGVESGTEPFQSSQSTPQADELVRVTRGTDVFSYATISEAFDDVQDGDIVTLQRDFVIPSTMIDTTKDCEWKTENNITFDFNGHSIIADENSCDRDPGIGFGPGSTVLNISMWAYNSEDDVIVKLDESDPSTWVCENEAYIFTYNIEATAQYEITGAKITGNIEQQSDDGGPKTCLTNMRAMRAEVWGLEDHGFVVESSAICDLRPCGTNVRIDSGDFMFVLNQAYDTATTEGLAIKGGTFTGGPIIDESNSLRLCYAVDNTMVREGEEAHEQNGSPSNDVHIYGGSFESQVVTRPGNMALLGKGNTTTLSGGSFKFDPTQAGATLAEGLSLSYEGGYYVVAEGASSEPAGGSGGQGGANTGSGNTASGGSGIYVSSVSGPTQSEIDELRQQITLLQEQGEGYRSVITALQDRDATLSAKSVTKTIKLKKAIKKTALAKSVTLKVTPSVSGAKTVFSKVSGKRLAVSKEGKVTLRKGAKRGSYTAKVKVVVGESSAVVSVRFNIR